LRYFEISATLPGFFVTILGIGGWITVLVGAVFIDAAVMKRWDRYQMRRYAKKKGRPVVDLDGNTYERWP